MDGRITNISALLKELNLNLSRPECGVLATLMADAETPYLTHREIDRLADLRQPEVSKAVRALKNRGFLTTEISVDEVQKGHPLQLVYLNGTPEEVLKRIEHEALRIAGNQRLAIERIKKAVGETG